MGDAVELLETKYDKDKFICGEQVPVEFLKMMVYAYMKKIKEVGSDSDLYEMGYKFGRYISPCNIDDIKEFMEISKLGKMEVLEKTDKFIKIKISHCALCESLDFDEPICDFEAGLLAGFLESIKGKKVVVKETACMAQGADGCYFIGEFADE
jgi:predicted hydrocarbon binding protein